MKDRSQRSGGQVCSDFTAMEETHGIIEQEKVFEIGFLNLDGVSKKTFLGVKRAIADQLMTDFVETNRQYEYFARYI